MTKLDTNLLQSMLEETENQTEEDNFSKEELSFFSFMKDENPDPDKYSFEELNFYLKNLSDLTDLAINKDNQFWNFMEKLGNEKCVPVGGGLWW